MSLLLDCPLCWTLARALRLGWSLHFAATPFSVEAALRRCLFLLVWLLLFFRPPTACPISRARGDGGSSQPTGWRRTDLGWEEASRWQLERVPRPVPTPATAVHPLVIASLELMISLGALLVGSPGPREKQQ